MKSSLTLLRSGSYLIGILVWLFATNTAHAAPFATTLATKLNADGTASLNGFVTPLSGANYWFRWGVITTNASSATNYANMTAVQTLAAGSQVVYVTNGLSGLSTGTQYHFQLVASNSLGLAYGGEQRFGAGVVAAWGAGLTNNPSDSIDYGQSMVPVGLSNVVAVAGGLYHSLVLRNDGTVAAWGYNNYGQTTVPLGLSSVVAVTAGGYHSLALRNDGTVVAWGWNYYGQSTVPVGLSNVVAVAGGYYHSLALRNDGTVAAWGGDYTTGQSIVPVGLSNVVAVAAGQYNSLALRNDGTVVNWGYNPNVRLNVPTGLSNVLAVAAGANHSLALRNDGTVMAWGDNTYGQLNVPAGLSNAVAVGGGYYHSLALRNDGTVMAWGYNSNGQTNIPTGLNNAIAVAAGAYHSLAVAIPFISTTTVLAFSPNPAIYNQPLTLLAIVSPAKTSGWVIFYDGATAIGTNILYMNSVATWTIANLNAGSHHFTAAYCGDINYFGSTSAVYNQTVGTLPAASILTTQLNPNDSVQISFTGDTNWTYTIETSTNLTTWSVLTNLTSTSGSFSFIVGSTTNAPQQFYRARVGP